MSIGPGVEFLGVINLGLIGFGYWGTILARNLAEAEGVQLAAIADLIPARLDRAARQFPCSATYLSASSLLANQNLDAVVIATPISTHYALCKAAIERGKHVLVEKPMAGSVREGSELVDLAHKKGVRLSVDHTFIYSGAIRKIHSLIATGKLGELVYLDSVRANFGLFQQDANVIWDLASHDFAILDYLFFARPSAISASATCFAGYRYESVAHVTIHFDNGCLGHFHVNWLAPNKVRHMLICGSSRMIDYDDLRANDKVRVYDKCVTVPIGNDNGRPTAVSYCSGGMCVPTLEQSEPVGNLIREFVEAIEQGRETLTDGVAGLRVITLLDAAQQSLGMEGRRICLR